MQGRASRVPHAREQSGWTTSPYSASTVQGPILVPGLLHIIFGALLLSALARSGAIATIRSAFTDTSPDRRVQAIIIGRLFGSQSSTADHIGIPPETVVAAQAVGGAAGNMITVHNAVAASAVVGLVGGEGGLIRQSVPPMTHYVLMAGAVSCVFVHGFGPNAGTVMLVLAALAGLVLLLRRADADKPPARVPEHRGRYRREGGGIDTGPGIVVGLANWWWRVAHPCFGGIRRPVTWIAAAPVRA